jgi:hypothetical protein
MLMFLFYAIGGIYSTLCCRTITVGSYRTPGGSFLRKKKVTLLGQLIGQCMFL